MGAVVFGSGIVIGLSLVGAGYTSAGLLSTVVVALVSLADYLYVPMPAFAEEKGQRQKILAKLRLGNFWIWLQTLMGRGHIMQLARGNFHPTATNNPPDPEVTTEDTKLDGINVRIYQPTDLNDDEELPGVIYFHGGGFCWESFGLYDIMIKKMLKLKRMVVVYVRYRLAPEFPFPAAVDDCFIVTRYVQMNTRQFRMDPQRLVLMGDSAGGNLTMNMLIRMITEAVPSLPKFKLQIAIYPYIQALDFKTPSYQIYDNPKAPTLLNADIMIKFLITYALGFTTFDESEIRNLLENKHWTAELKNSNLPKLVNDDVLPENLERPKLKTPVSKSVDSSLARKYNDIFLDPRFSPLFANDDILRKIPKTYILSTELDCIRDDAFFLADRLRKLDVDVTHRHWGGMDHPFLVFQNYENSFKALKEITNFMNDNL